MAIITIYNNRYPNSIIEAKLYVGVLALNSQLTEILSLLSLIKCKRNFDIALGIFCFEKRTTYQ